MTNRHYTSGRPQLVSGKLKRRAPRPAVNKKLARRKRLPTESVKRRAERVEREALRQRVLERADGCAARKLATGVACMGRLEVHEISKRSRKPGCHLDEDDCIAVCSRHNSWIEDQPRHAQALGLAKWSWE